MWRPDWPCPVSSVLHQQRHGGADPTFKVDPGGTIWKGLRTPEGPVTLVVAARPDLGEVEGRAWGSGADWALERLPALLGAADSWEGFEPRHPLLAELRRRHPHHRLGRTEVLLDALVPAIVEQKVTGQEAFAGYRMLVHRYGEPAPGPGADRGLRIAPDAATLRAVPSWAWLQMHVDPARSRTIVAIARVADALERAVPQGAVERDRRLRAVPGIGVWTSAEVRVRVLGDPDAVSFGDYHVAKDVGWALTGTPFDDAALAEFLEPYRPQRGRVPGLIALAGLHRPRRGARMSPRTHLPARVTRW